MPSSSLTQTIRRPTREVFVGHIGVGGNNPVRIQSMTTTDTKDVAATVAQTVALAEAGCEIVRITAPNPTAARCLREIRAELNRRKIDVPLVADIHFLPAAAMEAVEHVEKIRINPGNYADRKKFAVREYTDSQYDEELARLHDAFTPLVKRCKELGRSMRIGTNHGSLSDRIMNRYGDTPLGMVESALEFLRIAESHNYRDIILSMKASNPKVMIQAYRLLASRMAEENMHYPLHLGVTEAGDGEDGRIKSAIGIGSLLTDGLGDTIRVSLTEDSVYEIPVARALADKVMSRWNSATIPAENQPRDFAPSPYEFSRRPVSPISLGSDAPAGDTHPPRVVVRVSTEEWKDADFPARFALAARSLKDNPVEALAFPVANPDELQQAIWNALPLAKNIQALVLDLPADFPVSTLQNLTLPETAFTWIFSRRFTQNESADLAQFLQSTRSGKAIPALEIAPVDLPALREALLSLKTENAPAIFTAHHSAPDRHAIGAYRELAAFLNQNQIAAPIWIRNTESTALQTGPDFLSRLLEASILSGSLLCDGIGDLISVETETNLTRSARLAYNVLQGAGARISKTEFVACPSCGRTLFDLQSTTQRIRAKTGHLKGLKIAVMGCIVNGPGEMADADFGYVGGAPGKVNLYVGKECVRYHVPQAEADQRLIDLIKEHGKWTDPETPEPAISLNHE